MTEKNKNQKDNRLRFYANEEVKEVLQSVIDTEPGINNMSQAVRFIILKYRSENSKSKKSQLTAMSKELSIVTEIVASMSDNMSTPIIQREGSTKFEDAKKIVEARIQKNITKQKKGNKTSDTTNPEETKNQSTGNYFLDQLENNY